MFVLYVDDVLCFHYDVKASIKNLDKYFPMKKNVTGDSDIDQSTTLGGTWK
jgi:hypothetical protein